MIGGCEHNPFDTGDAAGFEDVIGADQVVGQHRIPPGISCAVRRQVHHRVNAIERRPDCIVVVQAANSGCDTVSRSQIERRDVVDVAEPFDQHTADQSRASCYQYLAIP